MSFVFAKKYLDLVFWFTLLTTSHDESIHMDSSKFLPFINVVPVFLLVTMLMMLSILLQVISQNIEHEIRTT